MTRDLRWAAVHGNRAIPVFFQAERVDVVESRMTHACIDAVASWLRDNRDRHVAHWSIYRCEHY